MPVLNLFECFQFCHCFRHRIARSLVKAIAIVVNVFGVCFKAKSCTCAAATVEEAQGFTVLCVLFHDLTLAVENVIHLEKVLFHVLR